MRPTRIRDKTMTRFIKLSRAMDRRTFIKGGFVSAVTALVMAKLGISCSPTEDDPNPNPNPDPEPEPEPDPNDDTPDPVDGPTLTNTNFMNFVDNYAKNLAGKGHTAEEAAAMIVAVIMELNKNHKKKTRFCYDLNGNNQGLVNNVSAQAGNSVTENNECGKLKATTDLVLGNLGGTLTHTMKCPEIEQ